MALPQRKLHRLQSWDYSQNGYYHITICTQAKRKILSTIHHNGTDAIVSPSNIGKIIISCWEQMETVSPYVNLDVYCLMPNHLHGIIVIDAPDGVKRPSIPELIRGFKSASTREFNKLVPPAMKNSLWQGSYYDEIIRNDEMLYDIRKYIIGNPSKWLEDSLFVK